MQKRGHKRHELILKLTSQAAIEFLMTYGWMIMVVFIAMGALAYFGVLSPDEFFARKCFLEAGIGCIDFKVQEDSVILVIRNGKGEDITISEISVGECKGLNLGPLNNGNKKTYTITGCSNVVNEKFIEQVNITYTSESGLVHKQNGNIADMVEAGRVISPGSFEWITSTQAEFDEGIYSSTQSIPAGSVQLGGSQLSGTYTSKVFDAVTTAKWDYIGWGEPIPYKEHVKADGTDCATSNLKGAWNLEETSGSVLDSSLCSKNGVNQGAATNIDGKIGKAYDFDGVDDNVNLGSGGQKIFSSVPNELTGMSWIYPRAEGGDIALWQGWGGQFWLGIGSSPLGTATMGVHQTDTSSNCNNFNGPWFHAIGSVTLPPNSWHHLAGAYNKAENTIKIYANGILHAIKNLDPNECLSNPTSDHPPTIGAGTAAVNQRPPKYVNVFDGIIDEVVMYDRALSDSEILDFYKQGILNINVEVRSCDDPACNGEGFSEIFTDAANNVLTSADNRYFQYRVNFESEDTSYTPLLDDVTVGYTIN
jgi:hypothetical protein